MITRFRIKNLFGYQTVDIPFTDPVKILIGENGLGKTTMLNCLYFLLKGKYDKLCQVEFEEIEINFKFEDSGKDIVIFTKEEILMHIDSPQMSRAKRGVYEQIRKIIEKFPDEKIEQVHTNRNVFLNNIRNELMHTGFHMPMGMLSDTVDRIFNYEPLDDKFNGLKSLIAKMDVEILYFPTYRRVEEDLRNLESVKRRSISDDIFVKDYNEVEEASIHIDDNTIVHFGMQDVEDRIESVKREIKDSSIQGFAKVTGEMLSQLLQGSFPDPEDHMKNLNHETVKIILRRVGDNLSSNDRLEIQNLLKNESELMKKKELVFFLNKLMNIHNEHKHIDEAIKKFRNACNSFLKGKEYRFDESNVDLRIIRKSKIEDPKITVPLHKLSSGEKQIVSLFSKIFLGKSKKILVLFDEPELSLSLEWQKQLLPHVFGSGKCEFLLSVTHSPFIFTNELQDKAVAMSSYVEGYDKEFDLETTTTE